MKRVKGATPTFDPLPTLPSLYIQLFLLNMHYVVWVNMVFAPLPKGFYLALKRFSWKQDLGPQNHTFGPWYKIHHFKLNTFFMFYVRFYVLSKFCLFKYLEGYQSVWENFWQIQIPSSINHLQLLRKLKCCEWVGRQKAALEWESQQGRVFVLTVYTRQHKHGRKFTVNMRWAPGSAYVQDKLKLLLLRVWLAGRELTCNR